MPFSRPGDDYVSVGNANDQRYQITEIRRENLRGKSLDNDLNYLIQTANDLEVQIGNVIAGSIPGTNEIENKDKALITDGEGNIGLSFIDSQNLAERAVEEKNLEDASVSNRVLQNGTVTGEKVADRTLPTRVYMNESVTGDKIAANAVDFKQLAAGSVRGSVIGNKGIRTEAYGDRSIPTRAISLGAVGRDELSAEVLAGGLLGPEIGSGMPWFSGTYTPPNYMDADGRRLLRSDYATLFTRFGTTYGGSGLYFNLPDARGVTLFGIAPGTTELGGPLNGKITAATASNRNLGGTGGAETHSLTSAQNASHSHSYTDSSGTPIGFFDASEPSGGGTTYIAGNRNNNGNILPSSSKSTGSSGSGAPHNNMPPFLFIRYLIKVK